ncbi:MAG: hypothetical protein ABIR11_03045, partial [Candidatus Limnocylindrales bacterium]
MTAYPFPITGAKIHPPLLRSDTLSRPRLNDWMDKAAQGRVVLVVAEAGFGKTTFLGDWASKSTRGTAWYRLEPDDADWLVFLRHLVAAGRELDPDFAAETMEYLTTLPTGRPTHSEITTSIVDEYERLASRFAGGLTLILDDFHSIKGAAETEAVVRSLLDRSGEGLSLAIAARSAPRLQLGRLRSRGGLQRMSGEDLRFDASETDLLFREAYRTPLEVDVVAELIKRTDGWAALLTLVRTSLEDKAAPEARSLVAQLSATRGDLYDFLAEEVMATQTPRLQRFLTRASVLVAVDGETGSLVGACRPDDAVGLISEAESLGLLSRPDRESAHRFHPLVRDFLGARLTDEIGSDAVRELHLKVARALEPTDWHGAAWHFRAGGYPLDAARVIDMAVPSILASGSPELAAGFLDGSAGSVDRPEALILRSRLEFVRGNAARSLELGRTAADQAHGQPAEGTAQLNLATLLGLWGFDDSSLQLAWAARQGELNPTQSSIADAFQLMGQLSRDGDLEVGADTLRALAAQQARDGLRWYRSITLLNLAATLEWIGDPTESLATANQAEAEMAALGSRGVERAAAFAAQAMALMQLGRPADASRVMAEASGLSSPLARNEVSLELARIHSSYGSWTVAKQALDTLDAHAITGFVGLHAIIAGDIGLRLGDVDAARRSCEQLSTSPCSDVAGRLRAALLRARTALATGIGDGAAEAHQAELLAIEQKARPARYLARLLRSLAGQAAVHEAVTRIPPTSEHVVSVAADVVARELVRFSDDALTIVERVALRYPERWSDPLAQVAAQGIASSIRCAELLATIGSR